MDEEQLRQMAAQALAQGWEVFEHQQGGRLAGIAILRGTEFHCQLAHGFRLRRAEMREFLRPLFNRHGCLTTRVAHTDVRNQRFNRAFGFEKTWSDEQWHYYVLTTLPFEKADQGKENRCQLLPQ